MYKVAIVEDEWESYESLQKCLEEYTKEYGDEFNVVRFKNGMDFLDSYHPDYDIIFMDIDMPQMNGIQTAAHVRKTDSKVIIIFVTFFAKYAIRGYSVDAFDYVVKPLNYGAFKLKIQRAIERCKKTAAESILLPTVDGAIKLDVNEVDYIEIDGHNITIHTQGGPFKAYGTMREIEDALPQKQFCKCNRCYLVNLHSVTKVDKNAVYVGEDKLSISRPRRQEFLDALSEYVINDV